jgi:hypothetical protein
LERIQIPERITILTHTELDYAVRGPDKKKFKLKNIYIKEKLQER